VSLSVSAGCSIPFCYCSITFCNCSSEFGCQIDFLSSKSVMLCSEIVITEIYFKATHTMHHWPLQGPPAWLQRSGATILLCAESENRGKTYGIGEKFSGLFVSLCLFILETFSGIVLENIDQWCGFSFDWSLYLCHECFV
jgi:hypothetical protein